MAFRIAVSGLRSATTDLDVTGNNIANSNTTGFKSSRTQFADLYAASDLGTTQDAVGQGVQTAAVAQQFVQGNISFTDNSLDMAINGEGFFVLSDGGGNAYARAGAFGLDKDGFVVNSTGQQLQAFQASGGLITGAVAPLQITRTNLAPVASSLVSSQVNLDSGSPTNVHPTLSLSSFAGFNTGDTVSFNLNDGTNTNALSVNLTGVSVTDQVQMADAVAAQINTSADFLASSASGVVTVTAKSATATVLDVSVGAGDTGSDATMAAAGASGTTVTGDATFTLDGVDAIATSFTDPLPFDPNNAATYNNATSLTVYDSLGQDHLATVYFRKIEANTWETHMRVDNDNTQTTTSQTINFDTAGSLITPMPLSYGSYTPTTGASPVTLGFNFTGTTQYGASFGVNSLSQDGFATGRLSGIDIDEDGIVLARFSNGQSEAQGQVVLANFSNVQGLTPLGDTAWAETNNSGPALQGAPGSSSLGLIQAGSLEESNVNLAEQLVNMIVAQRNFQANAQVIRAEDEVTQTIINIR